MRLLATGLLVGMTGLYVAAGTLRSRYPALAYVAAFAEAAMIGGLADWFAVTALFRRPLGLPIPHTAIVPTRKDAIGRALARFIRDHFLVKEAVRRRLASADLAAKLGAWLERESNARMLSRDAGTALDWLMRSVDSAELRRGLAAGFREALAQVPVDAALATMIDVLIAGNHTQLLVDQLVAFGRERLERNRYAIRMRIYDKSPWWLPRFVDEEIYDQLVSELERMLDDIGHDSRHPARADFNERLRRLKASLENDPAVKAKGRELWNEIVNEPAVHRYFEQLWGRVRDYLQASFSSADSTLRLAVENEIRALGAQLSHDRGAGERLNRWLTEVIVYVVEHYRDALSGVISETVAEWDPHETAERIELQIGSDLQFIRVNGTLVGGLAGLLIYSLWTAAGL
ncbi:MAG TPA: DUF445 domain-containing protein [Gammaproteobacteria bacterium]|nr:DUF445 domain-containing protein [Gammaproteobacteria bacterium]